MQTLVDLQYLPMTSLCRRITLNLRKSPH